MTAAVACVALPVILGRLGAQVDLLIVSALAARYLLKRDN